MNELKRNVIARIERELKALDQSYHVGVSEKIGDVGVTKSGKANGYIYALGVEAKKVVREDVLMAIVKILIEDGLVVYHGDIDDYYVVRKPDRGIPADMWNPYHNLYCNDFGSFDHLHGTVVFCDGLVQGERFYEIEGKIFCQRRNDKGKHELMRATI